MPKGNIRCDNCNHSEFPEKSRDLEERVNKPHVGECRIDSPKVMALPGKNGALTFFTPFPSVKEDCWCSKFVPRGPIVH